MLRFKVSKICSTHVNSIVILNRCSEHSPCLQLIYSGDFKKQLFKEKKYTHIQVSVFNGDFPLAMHLSCTNCIFYSISQTVWLVATVPPTKAHILLRIYTNSSLSIIFDQYKAFYQVGSLLQMWAVKPHLTLQVVHRSLSQIYLFILQFSSTAGISINLTAQELPSTTSMTSGLIINPIMCSCQIKRRAVVCRAMCRNSGVRASQDTHKTR